VGFENAGRDVDEIAEVPGIAIGVAGQLHMHEGRDGETKFAGLDIGAVAPDQAGRLERLAPPHHLGFGQADIPGELGAGQAGIPLELIENFPVKFVHISPHFVQISLLHA
jgi:hypothetical protein